ncbi:MAG: sensor histidine kinase [Spirochaetaceae bacterium]
MKKRIKTNLSIGQNILAATLTIVMGVLLFTSAVYYTVFSSRTNALIESQSREINKQIVLNYENYINSVIDTANYIQFSALNMDISDSYNKLQNIFELNTTIKKDVVSIFLFDRHGKKIIGNEIETLNQNISEEVWFKRAIFQTNVSHFSAPQTGGFSLTRDENIIFLSRLVEYKLNGYKYRGVLLIELNFKTLIDLASKTNLGEDGHILILDDKDNLIYISGNEDSLPFVESMNIAIEHYIGGIRATINSTEFFISVSSLIHTRWRIVTVNNVNDIALAREEMVLLLFVIFIISFTLTGVISIFISNRITRPLNQLKDSMFRLESGDFNTKVEVRGQKEVVRLSVSYNSMIDKIRSLMDKVVAEQRDKRRNELRALQNQINPHFLYNTLDSIVWLAENHRSEDVITTVIALAKFFRISISKGAQSIPVKDEISHIENYLTIQKIRYVDKFEYKLDIEEDIYDFKVMKLILQPIVENAIYHGVGDDMGLISIKAYKKANFLMFEIENTGYGITEERILEIYDSLKGTNVEASVGMRNVYQRIKLFYGELADIRITSELDEKTQIQIIIPLQKDVE